MVDFYLKNDKNTKSKIVAYMNLGSKMLVSSSLMSPFVVKVSFSNVSISFICESSSNFK